MSVVRMRTLLALSLLAASAVGAQRQPVMIQTAVDRPERLPFNPSIASQLRAPAGFAINIFASGLGAPRMMARGSDGTVYVTRGDSGDVVALRDIDGDGRADDRRIVVSNLPGVH